MPLLGLIALIVLFPESLSPWGVLLVALVFTLVATAIVIGVLWQMFRPLREAADGLQGFMTEGRLFAPSAGARSWAAGLQRLEHKLFALRLRGLQAQVA